MSSESKESRNDRQQFWQMAIETFKASRLSVRQFCKQEGLSEPSFYAWRKKLIKFDKPSEDKRKCPDPSDFLQVSIPSEKPGSLELILSSGNTLRIDPGVSSKTLAVVLSVLCEAGLC